MNNGIYVSVRFRHPKKDVVNMAMRMGLEIKNAWRAGDRRVRRDGTPLDGTYSESYCACNLPIESQKSLSDILMLGIAMLQPYQRELSDFVRSGGKGSFYVGLEKGAFEGAWLDWQLLSDLGAIKMAIEIDREL